MDESQPEPQSAILLQSILDLLVSAGYVDAGNPDVSAEHKLTAGLLWCIAAAQSNVVTNSVAPASDSDETQKQIEEALKHMGCPHPLQACRIQGVDCETVFPVLQWLICQIQAIPQEEKEEIQSEIDLLNRSQLLKRRINEIAGPTAQRLILLMKSSKTLEKKESNFRRDCIAKHLKLQTEIVELEEKIAIGIDSKILYNELKNSLSESVEKLTSAKRELGCRLRDVLSVKRQLEEIPCQSELIQYDRRLLELNVHIQGKLRQTRKYYATYNALLEIKDLMMKETSLLNSISSQFKDAITNPEGRVKLIDSIKGIVKGSQQKLQNVHFGLQEVEKVFDTLKERYAAAVERQRQSYSLIKAFQEECAKSEELRKQGDLKGDN